MQTISYDTAEQVWEQVMSWSEDEAEAKMQSVAKRQPAIVAYLLHVEEEFIPPDNQGFIVHLGAFVIEAMSPTKRPLPQVQPEDIDRIEEENLKWAEARAQKAESEEEDLNSLFPDSHPQAPILRVLLEAVMSTQEEESELVPENVGIILLYLKTVVESLDQAGQK